MPKSVLSSLSYLIYQEILSIYRKVNQLIIVRVTTVMFNLQKYQTNIIEEELVVSLTSL